MKYLSRKFIAALLVLASSHWLRSRGLLESDDYVTLVLGTIGVYIAGNVTQKAVLK